MTATLPNRPTSRDMADLFLLVTLQLDGFQLSIVPVA
jgi:hypothetical protein